MFWFVSPWEAARRSLEAQRQLMALPWIFFASGRRHQGLADGKQDLSEAPPTPARSVATAGPAAVPTRRAMESIKGSVGARGKNKRSKRKNKSRKK
jgi:hypothetical protein